MKKRSIFISVLLSSLILVIFSCKKSTEQPNLIEQKVAMLAEGTTFDNLAFLASCKDGLEKARIDFALDVEYNIDTISDQYLQRIDNYCQRDFDLIIAIGYMWNDAVMEAATNNPEIRFILVDSELSQTRDNVISILFDVDEAAFPLGFLSAWWADSQVAGTPVIGSVGALEISQIRQFIEAFENGAEYYNETYNRNVSSLHSYVGSFFDPELGKQHAADLIEEGADVIFGVGSETGNGALLKAKELEVQGIGVDVDQYFSCPEVSAILISSAMKELGNAIYEVTSLFTKQEFYGMGVYTGNLSNQGVGIAPYHDFENLIPDSIKTAVESIKTGIINGNIATGWEE